MDIAVLLGLTFAGITAAVTAITAMATMRNRFDKMEQKLPTLSVTVDVAGKAAPDLKVLVLSFRPSDNPLRIKSISLDGAKMLGKAIYAPCSEPLGRPPIPSREAESSSRQKIDLIVPPKPEMRLITTTYSAENKTTIKETKDFMLQFWVHIRPNPNTKLLTVTISPSLWDRVTLSMGKMTRTVTRDNVLIPREIEIKRDASLASKILMFIKIKTKRH